MDNEHLEAIQNVVDRVSAYQDGAPAGTVEQELRAGLDEIGVSLGDDEIARLTRALEDDPATVSAAELLD